MASRLTLIGVLVFTLLLGASAAQADPINWATEVVWYAGDGSTFDPNTRYDPDNALGANDSDFLSVGLDGFAIFAFGVSFLDGVIVFETTNGARITYPESADIYVAGDDFDPFYALLDKTAPYNTMAELGNDPTNLPGWNNFVLAGTISNINEQNTVDVTGVLSNDRPFKYVLVLDKTTGPPSTDGFDINAVGVSGPVPEPGTMILFGSAAGLIGYLRRRKMRAEK